MHWEPIPNRAGWVYVCVLLAFILCSGLFISFLLITRLRQGVLSAYIEIHSHGSDRMPNHSLCLCCYQFSGQFSAETIQTIISVACAFAIWARGQIMFDPINAFKRNSVLFSLPFSFLRQTFIWTVLRILCRCQPNFEFNKFLAKRKWIILQPIRQYQKLGSENGLLWCLFIILSELSSKMTK